MLTSLAANERHVIGKGGIWSEGAGRDTWGSFEEVMRRIDVNTY
jgi:hypothetical protein